MSRLALRLQSALVIGVLFYATAVSAALPPAYYTNHSTEGACTAAEPCGTSNKIITFYVPHGGPDCASSVQGCVSTSRPNLHGVATPMTVDAVRERKDEYATCASDPSNYGKYFNIGTVTYRSVNQEVYTVPNVICYVHDTGSAFQGRPDKLDLATTVCPTCSEQEAAAMGNGAAVRVAGIGPVDIGYPTGAGAGQVVTEDTYCMTSVEPIVVVPVPAGTRFPSSCYNSLPPGTTLAQRPPLPPPPRSQPSFAQRLSQLFFGNQQTQSTSTPFINPQALLIAQPASAKRGNPVLVSWSSVGMSTQTLCQLSQNSSQLAQSNADSKVIQTASLPPGVVSFALSCTTQAGGQLQQSASVVVNN